MTILAKVNSCSKLNRSFYRYRDRYVVLSSFVGLIVIQIKYKVAMNSLLNQSLIMGILLLKLTTYRQILHRLKV